MRSFVSAPSSSTTPTLSFPVIQNVASYKPLEASHEFQNRDARTLEAWKTRGNDKEIRLVNLLHVPRTFGLLDRPSADIESRSKRVIGIIEWTLDVLGVRANFR
ncbi:hypothetical protein AB4Y44_03535 [Paraburkholderia sp. BR10937]|uniref:hypothetical protein n=1 Tax=unclassified Paraburkholderia TaxID=2615204 RepID=UPI0034D2D7A1